MSQNWEYLVEEIRTVDAGGLSQVINSIAANGWELMSVNPPLYYFKRARQDAPQPEQDEVYGMREA